MSSSTFLLGLVAVLAAFAYVECVTCPQIQKQAARDCQGIVGCPVPTCDGDVFAKIQCVGGGCYCADSQGAKISDYGYNYSDYSDSDCQCARDEAEGNLANGAKCNTDGSYPKDVLPAQALNNNG